MRAMPRQRFGLDPTVPRLYGEVKRKPLTAVLRHPLLYAPLRQCLPCLDRSRHRIGQTPRKGNWPTPTDRVDETGKRIHLLNLAVIPNVIPIRAPVGPKSIQTVKLSVIRKPSIQMPSSRRKEHPMPLFTRHPIVSLLIAASLVAGKQQPKYRGQRGGRCFPGRKPGRQLRIRTAVLPDRIGGQHFR